MVMMVPEILKQPLTVTALPIKQREEMTRDMTLEEHKMLAQKYIIPSNMIYVIAGDAATQMKQLKELGLGDPVLVDRDGNVVNSQ